MGHDNLSKFDISFIAVSIVSRMHPQQKKSPQINVNFSFISWQQIEQLLSAKFIAFSFFNLVFFKYLLDNVLLLKASLFLDDCLSIPKNFFALLTISNTALLLTLITSSFLLLISSSLSPLSEAGIFKSVFASE